MLRTVLFTLSFLLVLPAAADTSARMEGLQLAEASGAVDYAAGLVPALTESLGVTEKQASGGLGSLFGLAQSTLGATDFSQLSKSVPGMDKLLSAAPSLDSGGGITSMLGGVGDYGAAVADAKRVYDQFAELGLDTAHIGQYTNIVQGFLQSQGGQSAVDLFKKGVAGLAGG